MIIKEDLDLFLPETMIRWDIPGLAVGIVERIEFWSLVGLLAGMLAIRIAFLAAHFGNLESLWADYDRRGLLFHLGRGLDYATLAVFLAGAMWTLWAIDGQDPAKLAKVFVACLGWSLLARLPVHRFPRTNLPGAFSEAKIDLAVKLLMSFLTALGATMVTAVYYWWRE